MILLLLLFSALSADARTLWKQGDFVDQENAVWTIQGKKALSPERTPVKTDADGSVWYKDKEGDLFYLDTELLVPIYKGKKGYFRKAHKEVRLAYDYLCRERSRRRSDGTPFLSEFAAASDLQFPIRPYYEDVDRMLGVYRMRHCPSPKNGPEFEKFLGKLSEECGRSCETMAKGHQRAGDLELGSFREHRENEQVQECRKICGRAYAKELNALENYQAKNLLLFVEPAGAGKRLR